jgi:hypothetical protein
VKSSLQREPRGTIDVAAPASMSTLNLPLLSSPRKWPRRRRAKAADYLLGFLQTDEKLKTEPQAA